MPMRYTTYSRAPLKAIPLPLYLLHVACLHCSLDLSYSSKEEEAGYLSLRRQGE